MAWFIKRGPTVSSVLSSEVEIDDHMGKATVTATCWANGEGFDAVLSREKQPEQRVEVTWCEWSALKRAVKSIDEGGVKSIERTGGRTVDGF